MLDQITDPQNIGAVFRSAAAFGARAAVVQERRTPPLAGALAKAAAGAVETLPCVKAVNIARALEALKDLGYFCAGLAGAGAAPITELPTDKPVAVVLGAEGTGLRQLVGATCDGLFRIPINTSMESLNVSNAAAIALYEATRGAIDAP
ncbi:MAG: RNA methyltransferase [Parvularculaceae bacterium]